jgi:hypothetical protein
MRTGGAFARHPADPCPIPRPRGALPLRRGCEFGRSDARWTRRLRPTSASPARHEQRTRRPGRRFSLPASRPPRPTHAAKRPAARHPRRRRTLRVHDAGRDELRRLTAASSPRAPRGAASEQTPVLERCSCPVWVAVEARLTPRGLTWPHARQRCHSRVVCLPLSSPSPPCQGAREDCDNDAHGGDRHEGFLTRPWVWVGRAGGLRQQRRWLLPGQRAARLRQRAVLPHLDTVLLLKQRHASLLPLRPHRWQRLHRLHPVRRRWRWRRLGTVRALVVRHLITMRAGDGRTIRRAVPVRVRTDLRAVVPAVHPR